jgi:hypothetical protein
LVVLPELALLWLPVAPLGLPALALLPVAPGLVGVVELAGTALLLAALFAALSVTGLPPLLALPLLLLTGTCLIVGLFLGGWLMRYAFLQLGLLLPRKQGYEQRAEGKPRDS